MISWAGAAALASAAARTQMIPGGLTPHGSLLAPLSSLNCGDDRDRTGNLRLAKPALSQLSYVPFEAHGWHSAGLEWAYLDSNQGPQLYQSCALAN
jgi:hypothetical protein